MAAEPEEACLSGCGYVSSGQDLTGHMLHEHKRCPECGNEPLTEFDSVTHDPGCIRLRPGYVYPVSPVKVADDLFDAAFGWRPGGTNRA